MYDHAKTFVCRDTDIEADEEEWEDEEPPPSRKVAQDEEETKNDGHYNMRDAGILNE